VSPLDSTEDRGGIYVPKPKPDIYTVLLGIALFAILVACILLFLEFRSYGYSMRAGRIQHGEAPVFAVIVDLVSAVRC
jgi:hypothetical protein